MEPLISQTFGPVLLLAFIILILCRMANVQPDVVLRPFFGLIGVVVKGILDLFITCLKLLAGGGRPAPPPYAAGLQRPAGGSSAAKNPKVKIVVDEDDD